jgi:predicted outer membrane repeat protein
VKLAGHVRQDAHDRPPTRPQRKFCAVAGCKTFHIDTYWERAKVDAHCRGASLFSRVRNAGSWVRDRELLMAERLATVLFVVLVLLALPQPAPAAPPIFVGDGTPASCTESALKDALIIAETLGGGTIRFKCGPDPATIPLTQIATTAPGFPVLLVLPHNTTIDGGGLITLDGTFTATVAYVDCAATVELKRLSIIHGNGHDEGPGGIENCGTLTVDHSTLQANGTNSVGGAIANGGTLTVNHSTVSGNSTFFPGGGIASFGALTVRNSIFEHNHTATSGGAIFGGELTVENSTFLGNNAPVGDGGAIVGSGIVTRSTFSENQAFFGGAIYGSNLIVDRSTFSDNDANRAGGIYLAGGTLTVRRSTFSGNGSFSGGGLFTNPGTFASITNSTFSGNGGGFEGGGILNFGSLTVGNSTLSGNTAGEGGGIFNAGPLAIDRSTITENRAFTAGGGIYICVEGQVPPFPPIQPCHGTLTLKKTSVTENTPDDIFP